MFSQVSVILSTGGHAWQRGACMAKRGVHAKGGMCGKGGVHGEEGCAWQRGGVHGEEYPWQGGVHGWGHVWQGACMALSIHDRGLHGGMHSRGGHAWQERRPLQWMVHILLECILVVK